MGGRSAAAFIAENGQSRKRLACGFAMMTYTTLMTYTAMMTYAPWVVAR